MYPAWVSAQSGPGAATAAENTLRIQAAQSTLTYRMVHKLHKFAGVSRQVEGMARFLPDGKVQVMVRAPVESFDSQNASRDAHMKEVVEAARHPMVVLKAVGDVKVPASFPTTMEQAFTAEILFHGVKKTMPVPVKFTFDSATKVAASAQFVLSLTEFKLERPSLMFVKVDDALQVDVSLQFGN
ncbi:MAG TPA: YceI family protein [Pseudomonadota bacterium]|nr:YceI family protein [Pseudomonadota bacterium]